MTFTIYLLHFDAEVSKCRHYVGSCETARFDRRMQEHAGGYGANLTRRAFQQKAIFQIARLWQMPARDFEQTLKKRSHFPKLCPICNPRLNLELPLRPARLTDARLVKSDFAGVGFPSEAKRPRSP